MQFYTDDRGCSEFELGKLQSDVWKMNVSGMPKGQLRDVVCEQCLHLYDGFVMDTRKMESVIQRIYKENDALRTILIEHDGRVLQKIVTDYEYQIDIRPAEGTTKEERLENAKRMVKEESEKRLTDFEKIMSKIIWFRVDEDDYLLFIATSHVVSDGVSNYYIFRKIMGYYLDENYVDHCAHFSEYLKYEKETLNSEVGEKYRKYWDERVQGYQKIEHNEQYAIEDSNTDQQILPMMFPLSDVKRVARAYKTNDFSIFLTGFHYMIAKYYQRNDTLVVFACANRRQEQFRSTVGLLARTLPNRLIISDEDTFSDILEKVTKGVYADLDHQEFPDYDYLTEFWCSKQRDDSLMNRIPNYNGKIEYIYLNGNSHLNGFNLFAMAVNDLEDRICVEFFGNRAKYSRDCIDSFKNAFQECIDNILNNPDRKIKELLNMEDEHVSGS